MRLFVPFAFLLLAAPFSISPTACSPSTTSYVVSAIPPNGTSTVCLRLDAYSFTITNGLIQIRTHFVDSESPTGAIDGFNTAFKLANPPSPQTSLKLYFNGLRAQPGLDYSVNGAVVTMTSHPRPGDTILADYRF